MKRFRSFFGQLLVVAAAAGVIGALLLRGDEPPLRVDCLERLRTSARETFPGRDLSHPREVLRIRFDRTREDLVAEPDAGVSVRLEGCEPLSSGDNLPLRITSSSHLVRLTLDPPLDASTVTAVAIRARSTRSSDRPRLFFARPGEDAGDLYLSVPFEFPYDEELHTVLAPVEDHLAFRGEIGTLALRFMYTPGALALSPARLDLEEIVLYEAADPLARAALERTCRGEDIPGSPVDLLTEATLNNEVRPALYAPPLSRYECPVDVPEDAYLDVDYGCLESSWGRGGDGVTFAVSISPSGGEAEALFLRHVNPSSTSGKDWRWLDTRIPLERYAGQRATLVFETFPGGDATEAGDPTGDHPVWSNVDLVRGGLAAGDRPPSFVVICLDTLRADRLGCYGYPRPTSPHLDAFAREGVVFERATSQAPETVAAHMSLFTGLYPREHRVWDTQTLSADLPHLVEELRDRGYRTAAFTEDGGVSSAFGFSRGFQSYHDGARSSRRGLKLVEETFGFAADFIRRHRDRPFFLFVHTYETHTPYDPPDDEKAALVAPYAGAIRPPVTWAMMESLLLALREAPLTEEDYRFVEELYDAGIRHVDAELGKLLSILSEAGLDDSTYRVVLSDHGEDFWDHFGFATHGHSLYEELIHVPLMVRGPDLIPGTRVKERVQLLDVLPTLLELAGVPGPEEKVSGLSFRRLLAGRAGASRPAFSEDHTLFERVAVLSDLGGSPWKLIHSPSIESHEMIPHIRALVDLSRFEGILQEWELFDLATDPGETKNLASSRPRERKALEALLEGFLRDHPLGKAPPGAALDPDIQRRLMELGYTVDPPVPKKEEEADGEGG